MSNMTQTKTRPYLVDALIGLAPAPVDTFTLVSLDPAHSLRAACMTAVGARNLEEITRDTRRVTSSTWQEVTGLLESQGGCQYGCKLYARKRGAVTQTAIFHSSTYGHPRSAA